jgi:hypothetical protein
MKRRLNAREVPDAGALEQWASRVKRNFRENNSRHLSTQPGSGRKGIGSDQLSVEKFRCAIIKDKEATRFLKLYELNDMSDAGCDFLLFRGGV